MRRIALAGAIVLAVQFTTSAQDKAPTLPGYPAAGQPPQLTLLTAGTGEKKALRYAPAAGTKEHIDMATTIGVTMDMGGMQMPPMNMPSLKITGDVDVTSVTPAGEISFALQYDPMKLEGGDPTMAAQMQGVLGGMPPIKGTGVMSSRGEMVSMNIDTSALTASPAAQVVGPIAEQLKNIATLLPVEPVGVGATWEIKQAVSSQGMTVFQRTGVELTAMDATSATLKTTIEQTVPQQSVSNPALPGATMDVDKGSGKGSGTIVIHLNGFTPSGDTAVSTSLSVSINMSGMNQAMNLSTSTSTKTTVVKK